MRLYAPIAKVDADEQMVWGYASTEAQDDQGEIVTRDALKAALDEYMAFANIREMHQLSAVGVATEAGIDDKGLYVGVRVVDDRAWAKITARVYKGFSIGGRVKARDPADRTIITGLVLNEISLVDRPANPEAVFDCWKAEGVGPAAPQPVQIWHCGVADHRHSAKAEAARCLAGRPDAAGIAKAEPGPVPAGGKPYGDVLYADPGYRADGRKRYPIDTAMHVRAAWAYINKPGNARKYAPDQVARIKSRIIAVWKETIDPEGPPAARIDDRAGAKAARDGTLREGLGEVGRVAHLIVELHWLDARLAVEAAVEGDASPLPSRLQAITAELCDFLNALVAEETAELVDGGGAGEPPPPTVAAELVVMAAGIAGTTMAEILGKAGDPRLDALAAALGKLGAGHDAAGQRLLDHVHDCLMTLTDGGCCAAQKSGARPPKKARRHLQRAHDHVCAAGARCDGDADGASDSDDTPAKASGGRLAKALAGNAVLMKALGDIAPRLDRLAQRVEDIARTPLPPLTIASGAVALSKRDDGGERLPGDVVAALARMSGEERTLALIKAAHANPIRAAGDPSPARNPASVP